MLLILWFHTEMYVAGRDITPYDLYVPNALTTFFFLSGYLFAPTVPGAFAAGSHTSALATKLTSIARKLLLPYFVFTLLLAVPKAVVLGVPLKSVITAIAQGNGSWFVAALIVAETLLALAMATGSRWVVCSLPVASLAAAWALTGTSLSMHHNYWNFHNALLLLPFLCLGLLFRHSACSAVFQRRPWLLIVPALLLILIKLTVVTHHHSQLVEPVAITSYPLFVADMVCAIAIAVAVVRQLPPIAPLSWLGRNTLVCYFFCGAVPALVARCLPPYAGNYLTIPLAFVAVCLVEAVVIVVSNKIILKPMNRILDSLTKKKSH